MINESENNIQASFFEWLALHEKKHPELGLFYAIPNGSYKSFTAKMLHQATGLKSGVPDCHLPVVKPSSKTFHIHPGLYIEFKSKTGKVSDNQKEWIEKLRAANHRVEVCRSWVEAANITIEYLGLDLEPLK